MVYSIKNDVQILGINFLGKYTTAQRTGLNASLGAGDVGGLVYDTDTSSLYYWDNNPNWVLVQGGATAANLTLGTINANTVEILIDTGTDVTIPSATNAAAGVATATQITNLEALVALDGVAPGAANLGTFTGTIISDSQTIKGALQDLETDYEAFKDSAGQPNGLATLDGGGLIPTSQLPALAITDVYVVADITARDALTVQEGDVAKVTDSFDDTGFNVPQTYIYDGSAWVDIQETSDVVSVNGFTGAVVLTDADIAYDDTPAPAGSPTEGTTTVEGAIDALNTAVNDLENANNSHTETFLVANWVGPTSGRYTFTVSAGTHGLTAADITTVQVQELISANNYRVVETQTDINLSTGDVVLTIRSSPDARFDGRVIITQDH